MLREDVGEKLNSAEIGVLGLYEVTYEPWIESLVYVLSNSSSRITLIDHQMRMYENPLNFKWTDIRSFLKSATMSSFDIVISYLSVEKLGLGRYGESTDLDADLDTVEQIGCMLRPGGLLVLGLSLSKDVDLLQRDGYIVYNTGRVYGENRLHKMTNGWRLKSQRVFNYGGVKILVLQKSPV